jgi:hypothetical protein
MSSSDYRVSRFARLARLSCSLVLASMVVIASACEQVPPRRPVCDAPIPPQANVCHVAGDWCAYDSTCCSNRCESESSVCH